MGKRGPHPRHKSLKLAEGTFRKDRDQALDVGAGIPRKPRWLSKEATAIWKSVAGELGKTDGLLSSIDGFSLARYCMDWVEYHECNRAIEKNGRIAISASGSEYQHPNIGIRNRASDRMQKFEARFGMTPSDRVGLKVDKPKQGVRRREG